MSEPTSFRERARRLLETAFAPLRCEVMPHREELNFQVYDLDGKPMRAGSLDLTKANTIELIHQFTAEAKKSLSELKGFRQEP
jgi:hypothetical protein